MSTTGIAPYPETNWQADWIWRSRRVRINDFAYFRKVFVVKANVTSAILRVSAHNGFKIYLNGQRVGGYVSPAPTNPEKRKYYLSYDVTPMMFSGKHCLTGDANYLGGSGQNYVNGMPGFRLELQVHYSDGSTAIIKTDRSWEVLKEGPHAVGTPYQQNRRVSAIEKFDAGCWDPAWRLAESTGTLSVTKAKLAHIGRADWPMVLQPVPEGTIEEEIVPIKLKSIADSEALVQVFDTGRIISGWPAIRLSGIAGVTLRMRYSEDLDDDGRVKHNVTNEKSVHYYDEYTMRGDERESWQPDFTYKAFRYVEITGYPHPIEAGKDLVICFAHSDLEHRGAFRCSDEHLNFLYTICMRTQKNNALGQFVDCPHREQAQYLADTDLQAEALLYNFEAIALLEKTLSDFADAQLEDGSFPFVAPGSYEHSDFHLQIPEWDLHFATLLWKLYASSGELRLLERHYATLKSMVNYFIAALDPVTGLVPHIKGWHISDWPYPSVEHEGDYYTVKQIKLAQALEIAAQSAALLERTIDEAYYALYANQVKQNTIRHLYDTELRRFRDSSGSEQTHQGVTAIALFAGVVPESDVTAAIADTAERIWESRTVLSLPLLRVLFDHGREAEAYAILDRREYPGWGYMIDQGAQTLWEGWEDIESHSHAWNGYAARLLQEYIVGIRSVAPGFSEALIRPFMPEKLQFAEAEVITPHGLIFARWERDDSGQVTVHTRIPDGVKARLEVRLASGMQICELNSGTFQSVFR